MAIILFSTTNVRSSRGKDFERLLDSLTRNADGTTCIRSYILLQNCSQERLAEFRAIAPAVCKVLAVPGQLSISVARNILFREAFGVVGPAPDDIIGFPDDDCWLPDGFVAKLHALFTTKADLDLFVCLCSLDPDLASFDAASMEPAEVPQIVRLSSSNNMFLRGSTLAAIGGFDPNLGVGTRNGGGEDTDFAIRAYLQARYSGFIDRPLTGHPTPDQSCAVKYFRGALIVLARHALRHPALLREFCRKTLVGIYFILRRRISLQTYAGAMRHAFASFLDRGVSFPLVDRRRDTVPT